MTDLIKQEQRRTIMKQRQTGKAIIWWMWQSTGLLTLGDAPVDWAYTISGNSHYIWNIKDFQRLQRGAGSHEEYQYFGSGVSNNKTVGWDDLATTGSWMWGDKTQGRVVVVNNQPTAAPRQPPAAERSRKQSLFKHSETMFWILFSTT